jgi:type 1 glutamine amidotransferase
MKPYLSLLNCWPRRITAAWAGFLVILQLCALVAAGRAAEAPPLKICLLSASAEYESDKSLADFQKFLENRYRVTCQRAFGKDKGDGLPGLEALDTADLMIVYTRRIKLPADQLERIKKYIASGRPILGIRTASHAFENFKEFDHDVLGGDYKGHYTNSIAQVELATDRPIHPVIAGVTPFSSRKLYKNPSISPDDIVLLNATISGHREPVAWVRERNGGRVFYTSLGVQEDFKQESFRQLLLNAVFWCAGRAEAPSLLR